MKNWILMSIFVLGCSGGSGGKTGEPAGPCYPNGTCNEGLTCINDVCVGPGGDDDAGTGNVFEEGAINQLIGIPIRDLDILVVVDNSGSMREEQDSLAANFNRFVSVLTDALGGLPSVHIGVVSTDLGAGPFGIMGCTGNGDNGVLQNSPSGACTTASPEPYIVDLLDADGVTRTTNYTGDLSETFACMARLGTTGCGFEQSLESMRRALNGTNAQNGGFLREDAVLAVLMITDEDDCSAQDVEIFNSDPSLDRIDSSLGFLSSFRCFEFGVVCDPDTPRSAGPRQNCTTRTNSEFMYDINDYASFLQGLKSSGGRLFFSAIAGNPTPVTVGSNDGEPTLEASCISSSGEADPAVRIAALTEALGMPPIQTICNEDLSDALVVFGENLSSMMSGRCLVATPASGECRIVDVANFGTSQEAIVQDLPSCAIAPEGPCSSLTPNSPNCLHGSRVEVDIDRRGTPAPPNTVVVASCPQ